MPGLLQNTDPDNLRECSVVCVDLALNHTSAMFQGVMRDISGVLKDIDRARSAVIELDGGTFGIQEERSFKRTCSWRRATVGVASLIGRGSE